MKIREDSNLDEVAPNLTPMIDVVFLLLIFFMVTTTFLDPEREIEIELPATESAGEAQESPEEIILNVLRNGDIVFAGETLGSEELVNLLKGYAQNDPGTPVTIRGHREARHESIVSVMDACGLAGLQNLAVGTTQEEG